MPQSPLDHRKHISSDTPQKKISFGEGMLVIAIAACADIAEFFLGFLEAIPVVGFLGTGLKLFLNFFAGSFIVIFFLFKGAKLADLTWLFGSVGLEIIPFVSILPWRTAAVIKIIHSMNSGSHASFSWVSSTAP